MDNFAKERLIEKIRNKAKTYNIGIDERVLAAIGRINREDFIPIVPLKQHAYEDAALPIGEGQTISQPFTVAVMTNALKIQRGDKVLEIGTGSGYQAKLLLELGADVYTIERNYKLFNNTRAFFEDNGWRAKMRCSDGTIGWSEYAPYKGIIVTAGSPKIPLNLLKQLDIGGRLVIPVGDKNKQDMKIITRVDETNYEDETIENFSFVPLIGKNGWKE